MPATNPEFTHPDFFCLLMRIGFGIFFLSKSNLVEKKVKSDYSHLSNKRAVANNV